MTVEHMQSNHEGDFVDAIQAARSRTPRPSSSTRERSGTTHGRSTTRSRRSTDRSSSCTSRTPRAREPWRRTSVIAPVATGIIQGFGGYGYRLAAQAIAELLEPMIEHRHAAARWTSPRRADRAAARCSTTSQSRATRCSSRSSSTSATSPGFTGSAGHAAGAAGCAPADHRRPLPRPGSRAARGGRRRGRAPHRTHDGRPVRDPRCRRHRAAPRARSARGELGRPAGDGEHAPAVREGARADHRPRRVAAGRQGRRRGRPHRSRGGDRDHGARRTSATCSTSIPPRTSSAWPSTPRSAVSAPRARASRRSSGRGPTAPSRTIAPRARRGASGTASSSSSTTARSSTATART